jgi:hypothetical protein
MIRILLAALALLPAVSRAADDPRISFLEQEVRNLQRQMQTVTWQLDQLRNRVDPASLPSARVASPIASEPAQWIDPSRWRQLRVGMSELEVIALLGKPSSMRDQDDARVLFYALEIGSAGFLGGSVKLRDRAVVEVHQPVLQ